MDYKPIDGNVFDKRNIEHMQAQIDKTEANLEFAMLMADIDIPEDDSTTTGMEVEDDD